MYSMVNYRQVSGIFGIETDWVASMRKNLKAVKDPDVSVCSGELS